MFCRLLLPAPYFLPPPPFPTITLQCREAELHTHLVVTVTLQTSTVSDACWTLPTRTPSRTGSCVISPFYHVQWCTGAGSNQLMKRWWTAQLSSTFSHSHSRLRWLWSVFRPWKLIDMAKQKAEPSCPQRWNYSTAYKVPPSSDYAGVAFTPPSFVTPLSLTSHIQIITMLVEFWFWTISHVLHLLSRLLDQPTSSACHEYVRGSWLHLSL